jgi:hypothetical protein
MPVHEVSRRVHGRGHIHVDDNEVVVAGFSAGIFASRKLAGLATYAFHRADVLQTLVFGEIAAAEVSVLFACPSRQRTYYSLRTATVSLLQPVLRAMPSSSVPVSTLLALASACVWMSSVVKVCLFENGQAEAPEKRHRDAVTAAMTAFPAMVAQHSV